VIGRLAVIGVGLIGGSLARALRRAGLVDEVVGCGRGEANLAEARDLGIIDSYTHDPAVAAAGADLVVVGVTLGATEAVFAAIAPVLGAGAVVTDVGSTKGSVVAAARRTLGAALPRFVPGHPIAGTEQSGAAASFAGLFERHKVILTPLAETAPDALATVHRTWAVTGATVVEMDVERHDAVLAATSHLPHLLAYTLVDALAAEDSSAAIFEFAAGGFRDFTRIASSNPAMWRDIALANQPALSALCRRYLTRFEQLLAALDAGDGVAIEDLFRRAKDTRDRCVVPESNAR